MDLRKIFHKKNIKVRSVYTPPRTNQIDTTADSNSNYQSIFKNTSRGAL